MIGFLTANNASNDPIAFSLSYSNAERYFSITRKIQEDCRGNLG